MAISLGSVAKVWDMVKIKVWEKWVSYRAWYAPEMMRFWWQVVEVMAVHIGSVELYWCGSWYWSPDMYDVVKDYVPPPKAPPKIPNLPLRKEQIDTYIKLFS